MKHGNYAVTLLTETDRELAEVYAAEIEEFNTEKTYIKNLIYERLKEKIYKEKVTSVFVDKELSVEKISQVKLS
jgi:single-stranded-DNA-specific exonuclease